MKTSQLLSLLIFWIPSGLANAHGIAGNRYFPGTITFDDPAVADELILPVASIANHPSQGANIQDQNVSWSIMRLLTPTIGFGIDNGYDRQNWGGVAKSGVTQTHLTLKTEVYRNDPDETLVAGSLAWGINGSGAQRIGANQPNTIDPGIFFGKGFGNLADNLSWLRPFGIAGAAVLEWPMSTSSINLVRDPQTGNFNSANTPNIPTLHWGFALEYSTLYLTDRFTGAPPKEEPLNQWVPLVEFAFDSPRGQKTAATMNPGLSYVAVTWQFSIEAVKPLNTQGGNGVGARMQWLFFLDDLAPSTFGKPMLSR